MEKKLSIAVIILSILFNIFLFLHISNSNVDDILLNKTTISFNFSNANKVISRTEFLDKIKQFSKNNNVEISQYSFLSKNKIDIYSTNIDGYKGLLIIPNLIFNRNIKVHDFEEIINVGFKNILYVDTNDMTIIKKLSETFKNEGQLYYLKTEYENNNFSFNKLKGDITNNFPTIFSLFTFAFILSIFFYYIFSRKKFFIYKIWGYTNIRIYFILNKYLYLSLLLSTILSYLVINVVVYRNIFSHLAIKISLNVLKINIFSALLIFISSLLLFLLFLPATGSPQKKELKKIMIMTYSFRVLLFLLIIFSFEQIFNKNLELKTKADSLKLWKNTQNLYNLYESYSPYYDNDLAAEDILNNKILKVYNELSYLRKVFIIETSNFERSRIENSATKNSKDFDYSYKVNVKKEEDIYSPYGRNIVVDKNYLERHIIKSLDDKNVIDMIDNSDNTLNILVPQKFKNYENNIKTSFTKWFYFQKIEVANYYNEAKSEKKVEKNIKDLKINIIYVKDGLNIFTYNQHSGDEYNTIKDTIITIYTQNIDNSFLASCLGYYTFIESGDEYSALREISDITWKYNVNELNTVLSVYEQKGEEISLIELDIKNLILNTIILLYFFIIFMVIIMYTYYKSSLQMIIIKSLYGYNYWQIYKNLILVNFAISVFMIPFVAIIYTNLLLYMILIIVIITAADYIIAQIISAYLVTKGKAQFIKGEI